MPSVLRVGPYRFFFFSREGQEPAHIHVESGDNAAKFWLTPVELAWAVGFNARQLGQIRKIVEEHMELFLEKWHEHFGPR
jgi:hypothetical protein